MNRALSHGCIRLRNEDVQSLARAIVTRMLPDVDAASIDSLEAAPRKTRSYRLPEPLTLEVVYARVTATPEGIALYPDIYGRGDDTPRLALIDLGWTRAEADSLLRVVRKGKEKKVLAPPVLSTDSASAR